MCIHAKFSIMDLGWTIMAHVINQEEAALDNGDNMGTAWLRVSIWKNNCSIPSLTNALAWGSNLFILSIRLLQKKLSSQLSCLSSWFLLFDYEALLTCSAIELAVGCLSLLKLPSKSRAEVYSGDNSSLYLSTVESPSNSKLWFPRSSSLSWMSGPWLLFPPKLPTVGLWIMYLWSHSRLVDSLGTVGTICLPEPEGVFFFLLKKCP